MPQPCPGQGSYQTRHGFGYSVFEHEEDGIYSELWVYVALDAPIKFSRLLVSNRSGRSRSLSVTGYVEWVLGDLRRQVGNARGQPNQIRPAVPSSPAMPIRWSFPTGWRSLTPTPSITVSAVTVPNSLAAAAPWPRRKPCGTPGCPGAWAEAWTLVPRCKCRSNSLMARARKSSCVWARQPRATPRPNWCSASGAALQPLQSYRKYANTGAHCSGLFASKPGTPAVDVMVNGWLMYQVIACRFQARSGYYQSGGAIGFRDQLQDSMAMIHADPAAVRAHLLLCAGHQYVEGDVQHWWHPPMNRGVRTACSDDFLWLVAATNRYLELTADVAVLEEPAGYLEGRQLAAGEESYYDLPVVSQLQESLYQHCVRAIEHSLRRGHHGLPLMGLR